MEFTDPVLGHSAPTTLWTTANVDEAAPDVLSPLCWSVWGYGFERGRLRSQYELGLLTDEENHPSEEPDRRTGFVFYGRQAANVDELRRILGRLPGVTPDDIERDWFGIHRDAAPPVTAMPEREPYIAECFAREQARQHRRLRDLHSAQQTWWREQVVDAGRTGRHHGTPLDRLRAARERFTEAFYVHCFTRYFLPGPTVAVMTAAAGAGVAPLTGSLLSGYGELEEIAMADALWQVGHGELELDAFVRTYGFHGPNEGNVYTRSWRDDPDRVADLGAQYARRTDLHRPRDRADALVAGRRSAEDALLEASPAPRREELEQVEGGTVADPSGLVGYRRGERARYARLRLPRVFTGMPEPIEQGTDPGTGAGPLTGTASGGPRVRGRARVVVDPTDEVDVEPDDVLVCRMTDPGWTALMALAAAVVTDIGNASSHGAVVARELGIAYVVGTGNGTEVVPDGATVVVDGTTGTVEVLP